MNSTELLLQIRSNLMSIAPNITHGPDCNRHLDFSNPASDYCNCGLSGAIAAYRNIMLLTQDAVLSEGKICSKT